MYIDVELHNPVRGRAVCSHCGCGVRHLNDEMHDYFAATVAQAFGEKYDKIHTKSEWWPGILKMAEESLASMVDTVLFCQYCGEALEQPFISNITGQRVLPNTFGNTHNKGSVRWLERLGCEPIKVDYHEWNSPIHIQRKDGKIVTRANRKVLEDK